jgi:predicted aspartyl protease
MGAFYVECEVVNVQHPSKVVTVRKLLVDTGSEFTWIPQPALRQAGIRVTKKDLGFLMANGQRVTRSVGYAIVRVGEYETIDEVVFAQPGDLALLGSRTLEGFGAHVDALKERVEQVNRRLDDTNRRLEEALDIRERLAALEVRMAARG